MSRSRRRERRAGPPGLPGQGRRPGVPEESQSADLRTRANTVDASKDADPDADALQDAATASRRHRCHVDSTHLGERGQMEITTKAGSRTGRGRGGGSTCASSHRPVRRADRRRGRRRRGGLMRRWASGTRRGDDLTGGAGSPGPARSTRGHGGRSRHPGRWSRPGDRRERFLVRRQLHQPRASPPRVPPGAGRRPDDALTAFPLRGGPTPAMMTGRWGKLSRVKARTGQPEVVRLRWPKEPVLPSPASQDCN